MDPRPQLKPRNPPQGARRERLDVCRFEQTDNPDDEPGPVKDVVYEPQLRNPPEEAMFQQSIGNGATLGVNVANGNLNIADPDVNFAGKATTRP